jgi:hypothetical protein
MGVCVTEVAPHRNQNMVASVVRSHCEFGIVVQLCYLFVCVVGAQVRVGHNWIVIHESFIIPKAIGPAVVVLHGSSKDLG